MSTRTTSQKSTARARKPSKNAVVPPRATQTPTNKTAARQPRASSALSEAQTDDRGKKKLILQAAVRVFAARGYHECRIVDVAKEAGVAYGLVYHYFGNKDGLLGAIFDTNWAFFQRTLDAVQAQPASTAEKLKQIVDVTLQAYELAPGVVKVLVLEFARNKRLGDALHKPEVAQVLRGISHIFVEGKARGDLVDGIDPRAMATVFLGCLETALMGFVLSDDNEQLHLQALRTTLHTLLDRIAGATRA